MKFSMKKKLRLLFCFLFSFIQLKSQIPLYCFDNELQKVLHSPKEFELLFQQSNNDNFRLKALKEKKLNLFWHLYDPIIGMQSSQKLEQPLSWNFSLWELAPTKGLFSTIVTIDSSGTHKGVNLKDFCKSCAKVARGDYSAPGCLRVEKIENISLCGQCKKEFFLYFLKNVSRFHGMLTCNIIHQLAPLANIEIYNIFDDFGYSSNEKLLTCLEELSESFFDVIHLGCKITSKKLSLKDQERLDNQLSKMNFIVAASGNDRQVEGEEAYPAKNRHVNFDVGAFSRNRFGDYSICPFSQFEITIGPKIVAPGLDILCPFTSNNSLLGFGFLSGTSMAAAVISGLLALIISEFKQDFSHKQILTVLYLCTKKLSGTDDWKEQVILGALDARSALFSLHTLREIKKKLPIKKFLKLYEVLICEILIINNLYAYKIFENKYSLQSFFEKHIRKGDVQKTALIVAKIVLMVYHNKVEDFHLKKLFDKKQVYLLRTIMSESLLLQASIFKHEKIKFALNRKE